jgi:hypothetical protein
MLEHAVREAAGGSSDVHAIAARQINMPMPERMLKLEATAADVTKFIAEDAQVGIRSNVLARLRDLLLVDEYAASDDKRLRAFPRRSESAIDEEFIEPLLHAASE